MISLNIRRVFIYTGCLSLLGIYSLLWVHMINSQAERTGSDFIGFYSAGRVAQTEGPQSIYIPESQQKIEESQVGFKLAPGQILLFNHLPYLVPALSLLVTENYIASFIRWSIILLAVYFLDICLLLFTIKRSAMKINQTLQLAIGAILFFPFFVSLMNGQDTVFVLLGAVILLIGLDIDKPVLTGLGLCILTIRPQLAFILAFPLFFYNRKIFYWFLIGSVFLGLFVLIFLGLGGTHQLFEILLTSSQGDWYGLSPKEMPTLTGMLHRILPDLSSHIVQVVGLSGYLIALTGLCFTWYKSKRMTYSLIGFAFLVSMFFVPYLHYHDLTLLLIPIFCLPGFHDPQQKDYMILIPIGLSFFLFLGFILDPIRYLTVSISMTFLGYLLLIPNHIKPLQAFTSNIS